MTIKHLFPLCCAALLTACGTEPETVFIRQKIPPELLDPVSAPDRDVQSVADVALLLTDYDQALDQANGQICAIGEIVAVGDDDLRHDVEGRSACEAPSN